MTILVINTTREEKSAIQLNIQKLIDQNKITAPISLNSQNSDLRKCHSESKNRCQKIEIYITKYHQTFLF